VDPAVAEEADEQRKTRDRGRPRVIVFLGHVWDELRRVQWPDRRQVGQATAVVLGFIVIAGGYLGLLDALWKPLIDAIL
jgi:preprotein translocase SecE subunit